MAENDEWIDASVALDQFETLFLNRVAAKSTLADCLRDGKLRARANLVCQSREREISDAWKKAKDSDDWEEDVGITPNTWRRSKRWTEDQEDWRWPHNRFSITQNIVPFRRDLIKGIQFDKADYDKIIRRRNLSSGGAPKKDVHWTAFWHAVVQVSQDGNLNIKAFSTQKQLRDDLLIMIGEGLSERSIKPVVSSIWQKFISPSNPTNDDE